MLGSTVLDHRQHVGLQQLSALAGISHSSLGPSKKYKFIQDDASGESALVCSCFRIFQNLELTCAVGQLVYETIQAHQRVYNTGSGCLLFLAGAWSRAALECLHRGISVTHIISAMSEGIDICIDVCRKLKVSTVGLGVAQSKSCTATSRGLDKNPTVEASQASCHLQATNDVDRKTLNSSGQRKVKLSRHFCEATSRNVSPVPQPNIAHIAEGLSHGFVDAMNLVVEANRMQSRSNQPESGCSTFDLTKVVTCVLPGLPEERACVLPGCIVLLSAEQAAVARHFKEQPLKVALIHGDLSDTFRHLGFSRPAGLQHVSDQPALSSLSKEEEWLVKVVMCLLNLEVNLILVSGFASAKLIQRLCRHHILVVEKVRASLLKAFANATGGVSVTYASQLSKQCIGSGVKVMIWRDLGSVEFSTAVNISAGEDSGLVTVILTSCVRGRLQALEDHFWSCAYRLHHALKDEAVLPGAGVTEMLCVHHLRKQAGGHVKQHAETTAASADGAVNPYRAEVLRLMAEGLTDYVSTVMVNTGKFTKVEARTVVSQPLQGCDGRQGSVEKLSQAFLKVEKEEGTFSSPTNSDGATVAKIYDNLSVKQEAWRKALDLVFLVLQTDAEVITGVSQKMALEKMTLL